MHCCGGRFAAVTLGLAYPWAQASLQRFKMRHTSYGDLQGSFAGSGAALFWRGLPIWLVVVGPVVFAFVALGRMVDWDALNGMMARRRKQSARFARRQRRHRCVFRRAGALGASIATAVLLYPLFAAIMMRWWISGLRFGAVAVRSQLSTARVYRIYLRFLSTSCRICSWWRRSAACAWS